jgi:hypothetical protein
MRRNRLPFASCLAVLFLPAGVATAAPIIIDDFEGGLEGHFNSANPGTASGTNRNLTAATADPTATTAQTGTGAEALTITPLNPGTATDFPTTTFRLRFLSGGGTQANNTQIGPTGYVGYFLKTSVPNLTTAIALDDGTGLEQGAFRNVIADNQWHLYQWNLNGGAGEFAAFAGTGQNGLIDSTPITIDSIFIQGPTASAPTPLPVFLDTVAFNTTGDLGALVPEPSAAAALVLAAAALAARRRKA